VAEVTDVDLDDVGVATEPSPPHGIEQLGLPDGLVGMIEEVGEHLDLSRCEVHGRVPPVAAAAQRIEPEIADRRPIEAAVGTTEQRPDPGLQHDHRERLGEEVVGAGLEALRLVVLTGFGREHEDRCPIVIRADRLADAVAVHGGKHDVEHDEVEPLRPHPCQPLGAVVHDVHVEAIRREASLHASCDTSLILNDEHPHLDRIPRAGPADPMRRPESERTFSSTASPDAAAPGDGTLNPVVDGVDGVDDVDDDRGRDLKRFTVAALATPFVLFFAALAYRALVLDWQPVQDFALFELRIGDVGTSHRPVVGPYSRFGWSHPGPLLFYVLAVPHLLFGGRPESMLAGAALVNGLAIVGVLMVAARRGGPWMVVGAGLICAVLMRALGADLLMSPWNPWITIVPTVLVLVLAWSIARRDWPVLPLVIVVASFLVQTHVAYGLIVGATIASALTFALVVKPPKTSRPSRRVLLISTVVLALVWAPVLVDQIAGSHNTTAIVRHFAKAQSDQPGLATALGVAAAEMTPNGPWVTGPEQVVPFSGVTPTEPIRVVAVPLAGLVIGLVVALKRRDHDGVALIVVAGAGLVASVVSIARISGQVWPYLVRFTWAVAAVVWLAVARAIVPALVSLVRNGYRADRADRAAGARTTTRPAALGRAASMAPAGLAAMAVLVLAIGMQPLDAQPPDPGESAAVAAMVTAVESATVGKVDGVVLVRPADTDILFPAPDSRGAAAGLVAHLRANGVDARVVAEDWRFDGGNAGAQLFGEWRLDDGGPVAGTITIVDARKIDSYVPAAGSVELYRVDNPAEVAEMRQIEADLVRAFTEAGHPEAIPVIADEGVRWVGFNIPELGRFGEQIDRLVTLRAHRREAVYWHPGR